MPEMAACPLSFALSQQKILLKSTVLQEALINK
jgi:hypothetical protein